MGNSKKILRKVLLWIASAVAVLVIGALALMRIAEHKLHTALADIPGMQLDFKKAKLSPVLGNLEFRDIAFTLRDTTAASPEIEARIEAIELERLSWRSLIRGEASAQALLIREPKVRLQLPGESAKAEQKDTTAKEARASFLKKVFLSEIRVKGGQFGLGSQKDSTRVAAQGIDFSVRDIGFLLSESRLEYNDSSYCFAMDSLDYSDAAGLSRIRIGHLATTEAGPVEATAMHLYNCVPMEEVAERMGKVSSMWYDVRLDSLYTSPLNIPRMVESRQIVIDNMYLSGPEITLFQDDRYPPAVPYATIQEGLNTLNLPLQIHHIGANIQLFTFIWETTHVNRGTFPLHNLRIAANSVSNAQDNLMELDIKSGKEGTGSLDFSLFIRNDKQESTHGRMQIRNLEASRLDPFLRPLFGATAKADIHLIDSQFKGSKNKLTNDFCMLYDHLELKAWDDSTAPFKIVAKNSGAVSFLANIVAPHSNPARAGKDPKKVEVTFERDPMLPYPSFIIQNLTMGMLRTVLPGGAVHKTRK